MPYSAASLRYDTMFKELAPEIPVAFMRRLAQEESGMNASHNKQTGAKGLLQITPIVAKDYIRANGGNDTAAFSKQIRVELSNSGKTWKQPNGHAGLFQAELNIRMARHVLRSVLRTYSKHPWGKAPDWNNFDFVSLVVYGWNAGYSRTEGVSRAASDVEVARKPVTVANVFAAAVLNKNVDDSLKDRKKANWAETVARYYFKDIGKPQASPVNLEELPPQLVFTTDEYGYTTSELVAATASMRSADPSSQEQQQTGHTAYVAQQLLQQQAAQHAQRAAFQQSALVVAAPMTFDFDTGLWSDGKVV